MTQRGATGEGLTGNTPRARRTGAIAGVLSLTALAALTACSGPGGHGGSSDNSGISSRSDSASAAPPGKYRTLPEPCGAVSSTTLHQLLPNSQDYDGEAAATFDTDRRVGCKWSGSVAGGNRYLHIDFERVVSYDPAVSDEDKAAQEYERMAAAAHIPAASPAPSATAARSPAPSQPPTASASAPSPAQPSSAASASASAAASDTAPRRVGGIGDEAYLNDAVMTQDSGVHRDVTVVFRTANVLVTIEFSQWSTNASVIPPSVDLQLGAHGLAQELARKIEE
ncbi:hypothetical protein ACFOSC_05670 [Streptantibioticus rubrisoli]|uniref:DUF3558 domain-containing protein n=1 Tax=Streptantibioticus rubrisoli TaxID=1387313 RepID=A0ABT1PIK9_9ACTN|nr:hypothetical protein [Streptantibioticus rubrisoli]MCQ4045205.1 hypothetical protein [Streptantibioticus rubrisoli]